MGPKRSSRRIDGSKSAAHKREVKSSARGPKSKKSKRPRQAESALVWSNEDVDEGGRDSESDEGIEDDAKRRKLLEAESLAEAAEAADRETPEEKRLRFARDVLLRLDAEQRENENASDGEDEQEKHDYVGQRLAHSRLEASGQLYREVAQRLRDERIDPSRVRRLRGHKLTPTCVALSPDDTAIYSGSKDNSILRWDVVTGSRMVIVPHWRKLPHGVPEVKAHSKEILSLAISGDGLYLASGGRDGLINVWDCHKNTLIETFRGHQDAVSALAFRANSLALYSGSHDRCVKHWDLNEMGYIETMFGHQAEINSIDAWRKERAITGGRDHTVRLWKVLEESHLVFRPVGGGSVDCISMINEDWFVSGGEDGNLSLWFAMKKKPAFVVHAAHGVGASGNVRWITALTCLKQSDLVVSGSSDGFLRLWRADMDERTLTEVLAVPLTGFVNGVAVSSSGQFVVAAVGQEHRLGRWEHQKEARNEICIVPLPYDEDATMEL